MLFFLGWNKSTRAAENSRTASAECCRCSDEAKDLRNFDNWALGYAAAFQ